MLNRLIAENYGFQNDLAGVTSGTVTELLASKFGMSPERAAALVVAVRLGVAAFNAAKGGGGAKGTGGTTVDRSGPTVAPPSKPGFPASQADDDFGYLNQPGPSKPPAFFDAQASAKGFINNVRIYAADLQKLVPPGKPDLFKPSATFTDGSKFQYTLNGQRVEIKWHAPDANAAMNHVGSNSGAGWTAQIKIGNKLLGQDGVLYRRPSNTTHTCGFLSMKNFEYYASLPDFMTKEELETAFTELLDEFEPEKNGSAVLIKSLVQLSERQWHTYSLLDDSLRERIEHCLLCLWSGHDLKQAEEVISIMASLGLEAINTFLASRSPKDVSPEVFNEISLALSELGSSVSDPYIGMR